MQYDDDIEHIFVDDEEPSAVPGGGRHGAPASESREAYRKFAYVMGGVLLVSTFLTFVRGIELERFIADFMAVFFITFAALKFIDIEGFALAYRDYDILASRIRPWGFALPFLEAFMGFWYLLSEAPNSLNLLVIVVAASAAYGALTEMRKKSRFSHTYFDGFVRLPMARAGFIENFMKLGLAILLLFV